METKAEKNFPPESDSQYSSVTASAHCGLCSWLYRTSSPHSSNVVPDGCQDFILDSCDPAGITWFISPLTDTSYTVPIHHAGTMQGVRLKPGTCIDHHGLEMFLQAHDPADLLDGDQLDEFCVVPEPLSAMLAGLAQTNTSVKSAADDLGISTRTLQRAVTTGTGRTPQYWLALARVRRAARSVPEWDSLAELAIEYGYSDQAHFTRESRRWLGVTPTDLMKNSALRQQLCEVGYAD